MIKVAINGYGTIGRRVADAVIKQHDMEIIGVTKTKPTYEARVAIDNGLDLYSSNKENFEKDGYPIKGTTEELLEKTDIVIDCTPDEKSRKGAEHPWLKMYEKLGKKYILQGGEKHELTKLSFNAYANYEKAFGEKCARVVSCNTTGLCRALYPLKEKFEIDYVIAFLTRRAVDPYNSEKGPVNAIEPSKKVPTHHGPDVKTIISDLNIQTMAVKVPTTIMHTQSVVVKFKNENVKKEDVVSVWEEAPRIVFVSEKEGIKSTAQVMDMAREKGRKRGDLYENVIWKDGINVLDGTLYFSQAIDQQSIVIPENIDAIRALCELEEDKMNSIRHTDSSLGIGRNYVRR